MVLDGRASDPVPVLSGVPQGSVLGPVLFLIFINDFPDNIRSSVRLFADDCVLYRNIKSPLDCQILQDDLNSLAKWEMDWQMKFNVSKCHSMRVTRLHPSRHIEFNYTLHQQTLEQVQSAKYIGLTITDDLWSIVAPSKKHNRAGPGQTHGKYRRFRAGLRNLSENDDVSVPECSSGTGSNRKTAIHLVPFLERATYYKILMGTYKFIIIYWNNK